MNGLLNRTDHFWQSTYNCAADFTAQIEPVAYCWLAMTSFSIQFIQIAVTIYKVVRNHKYITQSQVTSCLLIGRLKCEESVCLSNEREFTASFLRTTPEKRTTTFLRLTNGETHRAQALISILPGANCDRFSEHTERFEDLKARILGLDTCS